MIPFNKPHMTGKELWYIAQAHAAATLQVTAASRSSARTGWRRAPARAGPC
jgi:hypothetical protein